MDIATYLESIRGIRVERAGSTHMRACCPFHSERTPSFYIDRRDGHAYCYGGCPEEHSYFRDTIEVIFRLEFPNDQTRRRAIERAKELGIQPRSTLQPTPLPVRVLPDPTPEQRKALTIAFNFYHGLLFRNIGAPARHWLFNERRLHGPLLDLGLASVGFASDSAYYHSQLIERLRAEFKDDWVHYATVSGLLNRRGGAYFRDRVIFAVRNQHDEAVFLQARTIHKEEEWRFLNTNGIRKLPYIPIRKEDALYEGTCVDEGTMDALAHAVNGFYAFGLLHAKVPNLHTLRSLPRPIIGGLDNAPSEKEAGPLNQALLAELCRENDIPYIDGSAPDQIKDPSDWLNLHGSDQFRQEMLSRLQLVAA